MDQVVTKHFFIGGASISGTRIVRIENELQSIGERLEHLESVVVVVVRMVLKSYASLSDEARGPPNTHPAGRGLAAAGGGHPAADSTPNTAAAAAARPRQGR